ncbi:LysR substrate-binding domain-containing protein [Acidimangrovimonas pyrenivorans]|uniref:LysR substrate-binding domain-containing protein n=1 Tax=Acidimangrovimonas pyrenivorans TaxID=2030798 RepID=A0ABV7AB31_9RHOB
MPAAPLAPLPPLAAIRAFEAAARHRSFTRAAEELGMTQAAVSYQVKVLEDRVGVPLFRRRARGVSPTPEGARLAARAGEALEILRDAYAEARQDSDQTLVISVVATFATHVLAPRLGRFQIAHPEITTRVDVDQRLADLAAGEATVAIRTGKGVWPGLHADRLMRAGFTPMVSRGFLDRHGPLTDPAQLLQLPLVDPADPDWARWFAAAGVERPAAAAGQRSSFGTQVLQAQAVLADQGAGLLSPPFFGEALRRGDLVRPFGIEIDNDVDIWLVYPERRRNAPAVRAFRAWILEEMAQIGAA